MTGKGVGEGAGGQVLGSVQSLREQVPDALALVIDSSWGSLCTKNMWWRLLVSYSFLIRAEISGRGLSPPVYYNLGRLRIWFSCHDLFASLLFENLP